MADQQLLLEKLWKMLWEKTNSHYSLKSDNNYGDRTKRKEKKNEHADVDGRHV